MRLVHIVFADESAFWVLLNKFGVKLFQALKFLVIVRSFGPLQANELTILLSVIAVLEGATESGMVQASIQSNSAPTRYLLKSIVAVNFIRNHIVAIIFYVSIHYLNLATSSFFWVYLYLFMKSLCVPALEIKARELNFKEYSLLENSGSILDFSLTMFLLKSTDLSASDIFFMALTMNWMLKLIINLFKMKYYPQGEYKISKLWHYSSYSWTNSVTTLLQNNLDKIFIASSGSILSSYYSYSRINQLLISDVNSSMSAYMFPLLVKKGGGERRKLIMLGQSLFAVLMGSIVFLFSEKLVAITLGADWLKEIVIFKIQILTMVFGSLIAVIMPIYKANNLLNIVLKSNLLSITFLIIWFAYSNNIETIAMGYTLAVFISFVYLMVTIWKKRLL